MIPSPQLTMVGNKSFLGGRHNVSLLDCGPTIGDEPYDRQTGPQCVSDTDTSDGISNAGTFKSSACESGKNQILEFVVVECIGMNIFFKKPTDGITTICRFIQQNNN